MSDDFLLALQQTELPKKYLSILTKFHHNYSQALEKENREVPSLTPFLKLVLKGIQNPPSFPLFHQKVRKPFDYYQFGLDLISPLVVLEESKVFGLENLNKVNEYKEKGGNVILLANHQTEPDATLISLLLDPLYPKLSDELIFVAGDRVINDPLAIPISLGCNLLCIYSKRHIENPPEAKEQKQLHNKRTMKKLSELLSEGGKVIYIAPSGGRDRPNSSGKIEVAPFDPQSIEMLLLMTKKAKQPTHFFPLSLYTHPLLPPPASIESELGEQRNPKCTKVALTFGSKIDMDHYPKIENKKTRKERRAELIWNIVNQNYQKMVKWYQT